MAIISIIVVGVLIVVTVIVIYALRTCHFNIPFWPMCPLKPAADIGLHQSTEYAGGTAYIAASSKYVTDGNPDESRQIDDCYAPKPAPTYTPLPAIT